MSSQTLGCTAPRLLKAKPQNNFRLKFFLINASTQDIKLLKVCYLLVHILSYLYNRVAYGGLENYGS